MLEIITTYNVWLITSIISFLFSFLLFLSFLLNSKKWYLMFHQLSFYLAILDIITSFSWFISNKYTTTYNICCLQEYIFQFGIVLKGMTTIVICYLSMIVIYTMKIPSFIEVCKALIILNFIGFIFVSLSIYFQSADIFCLYHDLEDASNSSIKGYFYFNIIPLYSCVIIDIALFLHIRYKIYLTQKSNHLDISLLNQTNKLLKIVRKLLFYPLLFGICLLPEAILLLLNLFSIHVPVSLFYITAASMGLMGFLVSINYFLRQSNSNSNSNNSNICNICCQFSFWGEESDNSQESPLIIIGRNLSSLLRWDSSTYGGKDEESMMSEISLRRSNIPARSTLNTQHNSYSVRSHDTISLDS